MGRGPIGRGGRGRGWEGGLFMSKARDNDYIMTQTARTKWDLPVGLVLKVDESVEVVKVQGGGRKRRR